MRRPLKRRLELERLIGIDSFIIPPRRDADETQGENHTVEQELAAIESEVMNCTKCSLHSTRTRGVFSRGMPRSGLMIIGEAPGADEDRLGKPFVGRAGKLLDKMLLAIGLDESDYYITNIIKSRPPGNRNPHKEEIQACLPYLEKQIELIQPAVIVTLGLPASNTLLENDMSMGEMRGRWFSYRDIPVLPTYHPAYLLRSPKQKAVAWEDLKTLMEALQSA